MIANPLISHYFHGSDERKYNLYVYLVEPVKYYQYK